MLYLILTILCTVYIVAAFKLFDKFEVDVFQAIVVNYFTCVITGSLLLQQPAFSPSIIQADYFGQALFLGFIFIGGFYLMAKTITYFGMALTAVVQKMSIIITAIFAILYFNESAGYLKMLGIGLAILAVLFTNYKEGGFSSIKVPSKIWLSLPLITFLIAGMIESVILYVNKVILPVDLGTTEQILFSTAIFGFAGLFGSVVFLYQLLVLKKGIKGKTILAGILLGIPNFFSIYLLLLVLKEGWEGSVVFPIINVSIIALSSLLGFFAFKESLNKWNWLGVLLAISSIYLIAQEVG